MNGLYKENNYFFAAANSCDGFKSYFENIFDKDVCERIYILKGGPGVGKSTFMKRVAKVSEDKGFSAEKFLCSSDPHSLDGIIVKDARFAVIDGTSPHVWEPKIPGAREITVNLSDAWDTSGLIAKKEDIRVLCDRKSSYYSSCYKTLFCKKVMDDCVNNLLSPHILYEKLHATSRRLAVGIFKDSAKGKAKTEARITRAFSCKGKIRLSVFEDMAEYCIFLKVPYENCHISALILDEIMDYAKDFDTEIFVSFRPDNPCVKDALYFPNLRTSISLFREDLVLGCDRLGKKCRIINCNRFTDTAEFSKVRPLRRFYSGISENLEKQALDELHKAGLIHAELESIYGKYTNYDVVEKITEDFISKIF